MRIVEEKEDLLKKAGELEGQVIELDNIQKNDIESLEQRVESTIHELRIAKNDNTELVAALSKAEIALQDSDSKYNAYKEKYYSKKSEINILKDRLEKHAHEISRLQNENFKLVELSDSKKLTVKMNENKNKAYRDIRNIIDDFKQDTVKKY